MQAPSRRVSPGRTAQLAAVVQESAAVMDLAILFCSVPQMRQTLSLASLKALLATSQQLRHCVRLQSTSLVVGKHKALAISLADQWSSVQHLHIHSGWFYATDMRALSQSYWAEVKSLDFTTAHLDETAIACLATASWPLLQRLNLCGQDMSPACVPTLWMKWPELRYLNLESCSLEAHSMAHLVAADWPNLEHLVLAKSPLLQELPALLQLSRGKWSRLSKLDLRQISFDEEALPCLAAGNWPSLSGILLSQTRFAACVQLFKEVTWSCLAHLSLHDCKITSDDIKQLSCCHWPELQHLDISANELEPSAFWHLSQGHEWPLLTCLKFASTGVNATGLLHLVAAQWPNLAAIDLSDNYCSLDDQAIAVLIEGNWPKLEELKLNKANLGAHGVAQLVKGIWPQLRLLDVSGCRIDSHVLSTLAAAVWPMLEWLDLSGNYMDAVAFTALSQGKHFRIVSAPAPSLVQGAKWYRRWGAVQNMRVGPFKRTSGYFIEQAVFKVVH